MSWPLVKLGDVCERVSVGHVGVTSEYYTDQSGIPFLRTQNVDAEGIVLNDIKYITHEFHSMLRKSTLATGDVVLSRVVSASINCGIVPSILDGANCANIILARPVKTQLDANYLVHYLRSSGVQRSLLKRQVGSAQSVVNTSVLKTWPIPLPPLEEQKRIASILDKADAIRRKRQKAIKLADDFLRSVFLEMFGDPVTNPKGWDVKYLKDISRIQIGPFGTQLHKEDYVSDGIPLINPTHISGGKLFPNNDLTVSPHKHAELPEYHLQFGDIIMGRRGEMGRCSVIEKEHVGWLCGTGSLFIRPHNPGVLSEYLFAYLSSDYMKGYLESESLDATMPNLNKGIVGDIRVPLPPQSVMEKYAKIRDQLVCAKQNNIAFSKYNFFESLSQKAFLGGL